MDQVKNGSEIKNYSPLKTDNYQPSTNIPLIATLIIIFSFVTGAGIFLWQKQENKTNQNLLDKTQRKLINECLTSLDSLKKKTNEEKNQALTKTQTETDKQIAGLWNLAKKLDQKLSSTSSQSWKNYRNTKYKFSFRFPSYWEPFGKDIPKAYVEKTSFEEETTGFTIGSTDPEIPLSYEIYINKYLCKSAKDLAKCVDDYNNLINSAPGFKITVKENRKLQGVDTIFQIVERKEHGWVHFQTFFVRDSNSYVIDSVSPYNKYYETLLDYEKITDTIRFE